MGEKEEADCMTRLECFTILIEREEGKKKERDQIQRKEKKETDEKAQPIVEAD